MNHHQQERHNESKLTRHRTTVMMMGPIMGDDEENTPKRRRRCLLGYSMFIFHSFICFTYFFLATKLDYYDNMPLRTHPTRRHHESDRTTTTIGGRQGMMRKTAQRDVSWVIVCFFLLFHFFLLTFS
jgi:hypothetical protein